MFDHPRVLPQIAQAAPEAKILVILRDPVDRYPSGLERALLGARERGEEQIPPSMVEAQIGRGFYYFQVRRVIDNFPRSQVLILQYERCRSDYEEQLDRTYEFLQLEPGFRPGEQSQAPLEPTSRDFAESRRGVRLAEMYAEDAVRLAEIAPEIDVTLWKNLRPFLG